MTRRLLAVPLLALGMALAPVGTGTAHADRCEPEELVLGPGTSPIDERDHPACYALLTYVYPFVCDDYSTLVNCVFSVGLDPTYRPPIVPTYQPDPNRIYCNLYEFVVPTGSCTGTTSGSIE